MSIFKCSRADNSVVSVAIRPKFELIQAFMHVLDICKNKEDPIRMKSLEWPQHFSLYKSMGNFPDPQGQVTPQPVIGTGQIFNSFEAYGYTRYMQR